MLSRLRRSLGTSLGKKLVMALTGLALVGFLVVHLAGNLFLYADRDGKAFDAYAHALDSNPLLPIAEIGLLVLFLVHIIAAFRITAENREARSVPYAVRSSRGARTLASSSMIVTGVVVLVFLVIHLIDFRIGKMADDADPSLAAMVKARLRQPLGLCVYLVGVVALGIHLKHAFRSALHTLSVGHPSLGPALTKLGWLVAIVFGLGFASFPVYFFLSA